MTEAGAVAATTQRLARIELPDNAPLPSPYAEADRTQAVADLLAANRFDPEGLPRGPYGLHLCVREGRLVFDIRDAADNPLHALVLAMGPFRRLIKDYHMVVGSHEQAVTEGASDSTIQTIDMGRRGLHNEGAELLVKRLSGRVRLDFETARRLFTLVCALHQRI
ncbi:UPF0262 family protein [Pseudoroseomonas wenyumeiae]|uniref:UPF0262 family protein n=1 Tax=Teichococcus wenyumeiae TaxID=2478470 RepID=A0A3A9JU47_9PROT|nr:UPF0262 family protein [Pseudoroseomonas wenyumeiae]RKK02519.1 UPF0262 family protein [Pseudoroseomonas wenyumeiae]RMI24700.1 UPF0262 family protein [Pseudoroseomonas wenyumeiae]